MRHRIAFEIDGTNLTVTIDGTEHIFALGGPATATPAKPARKARATAKRTTGSPVRTGTQARKRPAPASPAKPKPPAADAGKKPARTSRTRTPKAAPATAAEVRAWAAASGRYPDLAKTGPLPKTLRQDFAAAHARR